MFLYCVITQVLEFIAHNKITKFHCVLPHFGLIAKPK